MLHLALNHCNIRSVLDGLYQSYYKLLSATVKRYGWESGQHWKVHVDQIVQNTPGWFDVYQDYRKPDQAVFKRGFRRPAGV